VPWRSGPSVPWYLLATRAQLGAARRKIIVRPWQRAWMKEWQSGRVSAGACASHRPMEHGSPPLTQHRPLPSLPLHMRNLLGQCMPSCTPKRVPHLPNTTMSTVATHAPISIWGASQLPWRCSQPTAQNYYTTAAEWITPTCDSLRWWHCPEPVISPTALPALPAILRCTISPCIRVSVRECEPWSRDGITRRNGNARPTCRMMILIWKTITVKHPNFSYPHKKNLHCRVHVPVEAVRVAD